MPALSSGVCSTSFWGDTMNKLPYFLVALCLCMFCSFSAYADDAADPAQADSAASSDEVVVPPEEGKVVQVQGVQTYDPQLYERMDKLQESIDALTEALIPAAEGAESSAEDAGGQDYTSQLSTISGQLVSLQEAVVMSTPESAEEPNIWDKQGNLRKTGNLDIFCGYFGNGKTLSLVKQVVCREYKRYDGLTVWCNRRQKFVTQRILILSNVDLCVPYERLTGLAQVCAISKANEIYDDEHDTLTITIVCMDELSVQMNSRSFKDNINAYFLNTLMCCRHYHISFYGSAQRFQHVDKMLRDVTMNVVQCKKVWRFQFNSYYDGFQLENAQDPTLVRPLRRACWFVTDADYNAYDTLQVVDNLQKSFNENDIFGARLAGTEVKRGWRFSPCSKYYPGGVEICGAEKILPDLYFCDGQAIMSMKLTEGST